jgi:hypothetical protein
MFIIYAGVAISSKGATPVKAPMLISGLAGILTANKDGDVGIVYEGTVGMSTLGFRIGASGEVRVGKLGYPLKSSVGSLTSNAGKPTMFVKSMDCSIGLTGVVGLVIINAEEGGDFGI